MCSAIESDIDAEEFILDGDPPYGLKFLKAKDYTSLIRISEVVSDSKAHIAGIHSGMFVFSLNGRRCENLKWKEIQQIIKASSLRLGITSTSIESTAKIANIKWKPKKPAIPNPMIYNPQPRQKFNSIHSSLNPIYQNPTSKKIYVPKVSYTSKTQSSIQNKNLDSKFDEERNDFVVLVIGVTGSGKSSFCNYIFKKQIFKTGGGVICVTTESSAYSHVIRESKILFVDTPGFSDEYASNEQRMEEIGKAVFFARNGVHAIIICIDGSSRFTTADAGLVTELDLLGNFWPHAFIVYTHAEDMGATEEERIQKVYFWLGHKRCPQLLRDFFVKINNRFMTIESKSFRGDMIYYNKKTAELLDLIIITYTSTKTLYTNELFIWAKVQYDKAKEEVEMQKAELDNTKRQLAEMEIKLETEIKNNQAKEKKLSEQLKKKHADFESLQKSSQQKQKESAELNKLISSLENDCKLGNQRQIALGKQIKELKDQSKKQADTLKKTSDIAISTITEKLKAANKQIEDLTTERDCAQQRNLELTESLNDLEKQIPKSFFGIKLGSFKIGFSKF